MERNVGARRVREYARNLPLTDTSQNTELLTLLEQFPNLEFLNIVHQVWDWSPGSNCVPDIVIPRHIEACPSLRIVGLYRRRGSGLGVGIWRSPKDNSPCIRPLRSGELLAWDRGEAVAPPRRRSEKRKRFQTHHTIT